MRTYSILKVAPAWLVDTLDDKVWQKMNQRWHWYLARTTRRMQVEFPVLGNTQEERIAGEKESLVLDMEVQEAS